MTRSGRKWGPDAQTESDRLAHGSFEDAFFAEPHIGVTGQTIPARTWSGAAFCRLRRACLAIRSGRRHQPVHARELSAAVCRISSRR